MKLNQIKIFLLSYHGLHDGEDIKRKKLILNTLCLSIFVFLFLLITISSYSLLREKSDYDGIPIIILFLYLFFVFLAFYLYRKNRIKLSSSIIIGLLYGCICYGSYKFGIDLPTVILAMFILVSITGILINSKLGIFVSFLMSIHMLIFNYIERNNLLSINNGWKFEDLAVDDVIEYSFLLIFAAVISWLNNIQLHKSLKRSRDAEKQLQQEKDSLDIQVKEKTEEIKKMQIEKINSMYRLVEFGRISSGLFHDIITPLTNVILNIKEIKNPSAEDTLKHLAPSIKRMDLLIQQAKKQIRTDHGIENIYVHNEIHNVLELLKSKALKNNIRLVFEKNKQDGRTINGSPVLFSHIITNLVSNAIDSYLYTQQETPHKNRTVTIKIKYIHNGLSTKITDRGCGIPRDMTDKIFDPFYTTKDDQGFGIGLSSTKHILEKYFNGKITLKSQVQKGTTFTLIIPTDKHL